MRGLLFKLLLPLLDYDCYWECYYKVHYIPGSNFLIKKTETGFRKVEQWRLGHLTIHEVRGEWVEQ